MKRHKSSSLVNKVFMVRPRKLDEFVPRELLDIRWRCRRESKPLSFITEASLFWRLSPVGGWWTSVLLPARLKYCTFGFLNLSANSYQHICFII